jgi:hypothetical protein
LLEKNKDRNLKEQQVRVFWMVLFSFSRVVECRVQTNSECIEPIRDEEIDIEHGSVQRGHGTVQNEHEAVQHEHENSRRRLPPLDESK